MGKPIIYLYFHSKILSWKGKEMSEKDFKSCFFQWRIPKDLRPQIMKEMEGIGLIKINKKRVNIKNYYFKDFKDSKSTNNYRDEYLDGDTKVKNPYLSQEKL